MSHSDQLILDAVTDVTWETGEPNKGWVLSDVTLTGPQVGALILACTDDIGPDVEKAIDWDDLAECAKFENVPKFIGLAFSLVRKLLDAARQSARQQVLYELESRSLEEATQIDRSDFERDDLRETFTIPGYAE